MTTIQVLLKNMERDKYAKIVHEELTKLGVEFQRYKERWDKLSRSIETVNKDVENLNITSDKITKKFESISDWHCKKHSEDNLFWVSNCTDTFHNQPKLHASKNPRMKTLEL
jgi:DNA anti-recombination protein RmuC